MTLIVNSGPLPADNDTVDPSVFLEQWIAGTTVFGLAAGAFKGGQLQFIYSQTEPPPLQDRSVGMIWFKRGDGRLYIWDMPDPSQYTWSDANWLAVSERRELWAQTPLPVVPGQAMAIDTTPSDYPTIVNTASQAGVYYGADVRPIWRMSPDFNQALEFLVTAKESAATGALVRVVELGFTDLLMASGETNVAGVLNIRAAPGAHKYFILNEPSFGPTNVMTAVAEAALSNPSAYTTGGNWLQYGFLHGSPMVGDGGP